MVFHGSVLEFSFQILTFLCCPENVRLIPWLLSDITENEHKGSWARWRNTPFLAMSLLNPPDLVQHPFVLPHQSVTKPFHQGCFTDARSSATLFFLIHTARLSLWLIVHVAGTPPGPAGTSDGHICHRRFARQWLGGDGRQVKLETPLGQGRAGRSTSLCSFPGQHGPLPALLGMVLTSAVVLGDAGV